MAPAPPFARIRMAAVTPYLMVVGTVLFATLFAFLQTDDFCTYGRLFQRHGGNPFAELHSVYMNWTGRYSSSFLIALSALPSKIMPTGLGYSLVLAAYSLLFLWACIRMAYLLDGTRPTAIALGLVAFASSMVLMPSKLEQYLWLTGAAVYFVGGSLLLLLVSRLARSDLRAAPADWRAEAWICALIVATNGFNEFLAVIVGVCIGWSALDQAIRERRIGAHHLLRIVLFVAAFCATVFAPGNFARDATSNVPRHDFGLAVSRGLEDMLVFGMVQLKADAIPFAASMLGAACAGLLVPARAAGRRASWLPYALILIASFPMHFLLYSFLTGEHTPGRIINQAFMLAHVAACLLAAGAGQWAARRKGSHAQTLLPAVLLVGTGMALLASNSYLDFAGTAARFGPKWHAQQLERHAGLLGLPASSKPVYVKPFDRETSVRPVYQGGDVGPDPGNWINLCVAGYYQVPQIIQMRRDPVHPQPGR